MHYLEFLLMILPLSFFDTVKYLCITITSSLSRKRQVSRTISKVSFALYQLKLCRHLLPFSHVKLVLTLIFLILDYCCAIQTNITCKQKGLRLQWALNMCVRFIFRAKWDEHITPRQLDCLKIRFRLRFILRRESDLFCPTRFSRTLSLNKIGVRLEFLVIL